MTHTLLVVDDEADIREILRVFLEGEGYRVLLASGWEEGIKLFERDHPQLVLLDVAMPKINGIEILRLLKAKEPQLPIIMITAYRDAEKVVEAFRLGAYDCIFKPFDYAYLKTSIASRLI